VLQNYSWPHVIYLATAVRWTVLLSLIAFGGGALCGIVLAICGTVPIRWLNVATRSTIYVVQGVPLLVTLFITYFGVGAVGIDFPPLLAASIALTVFAGVYLGEIWRGAVVAIDRGQWQAAEALGLRWSQTMRLVVVPQAVRAAIPPTVGFLIQLIKNTALTSVVGFTELTRAGQQVANLTFQPLPVYATIAVFYFVLCFPIALLCDRLEARLARRGSSLALTF
jgi:polar amino acid transport system permease protein